MAIDAAKLAIVHYPAAVLRERAAEVPAVDEGVRAVAERMLELMHAAPGVGLAAPQVGLPWRLFVANPTGEAGDDRVYINPELTEPTREAESQEEGCLSLPEVRAQVARPRGITIRALGVDGKPFEETDDGLLARIWQHETDHLDGVLILDRMTRIEKIANRRAVKALEAAGA
ncbi:MAG: peptide deformylase [Planctomycetota bacterium]